MSAERTVRVASVPDRHPYVDAVRPSPTGDPREAAPTVTRGLADRAQVWGPDPIWDVAWLSPRLDEVDVVHVHFGYDAVEDADLVAWLELLRRGGVQLVVTVHDLRNPHHAARGRHEQALARLVAAAAHVFTLTAGAAAECGRRYGRTPEIVAHPTLRESPVMPTPGWAGVFVPLKALRANVVDPVALVSAVVDGAVGTGLPARDVHVLLHPGERRRDEAAELRHAAVTAGFTLDVRPWLEPAEIDRIVAAARVLVLPYRFGSHSGWAELCRDLGTRVVAPDCGWFAEQWAGVATYGNNEDTGFDAASLTAAVQRALADAPAAPADPVVRAAERDHVRAVHAARYAQVTR